MLTLLLSKSTLATTWNKWKAHTGPFWMGSPAFYKTEIPRRKQRSSFPDKQVCMEAFILVWDNLLVFKGQKLLHSSIFFFPTYTESKRFNNENIQTCVLDLVLVCVSLLSSASYLLLPWYPSTFYTTGQVKSFLSIIEPAAHLHFGVKYSAGSWGFKLS